MGLRASAPAQRWRIQPTMAMAIGEKESAAFKKESGNLKTNVAGLGKHLSY